MHDKSCFVTLTYDDKNLPADHSLDVSHWQKFARRVRKQVGPFRFFHCGEYGETTGRPHYHAVIFGQDFMEDAEWLKQKDGNATYVSERLTSLWQKGMTVIGTVTFDSAAYVAGYCTKKLNGSEAEVEYRRYDESREEWYDLKRPYSTMSLKPGLGSKWYQKFKADLYPDDFVVMKGQKFAVPKYYDGILEREDPELFDRVKANRAQRASHLSEVYDDRQLRVTERVHEANYDFFSGRVAGGLRSLPSV